MEIITQREYMTVGRLLNYSWLGLLFMLLFSSSDSLQSGTHRNISVVKWQPTTAMSLTKKNLLGIILSLH